MTEEKVDVNLVSCKRFVLNFVNSFVYDFNVNLKYPLQIDFILWFALRNVIGVTKYVTQLMHDVIVTGADEDRVAGRAGRGQGGVWLSVLRSSYEIWLCLHMVSLVYVSKQS